MLYPATTVCTDPSCPSHGRVLRLWEDPKRVTMFSLASGVFEGFAVATSCRKCRATYYPNYVVRGDVRQYYEGIPDYVQVADHTYIENALLEHFTMLSVLSWTSSTNTAHIYHESMSHLPSDARDIPRFQLRTEHTSDGFVLLALLRDAKDRGSVLEVPNSGDQQERFKDAMIARNRRIQFSGQPEYAHWCQKCHRRFDDDSGPHFVDCIVTDGISIGRPCCGVQNCREPLRTPQDHWCARHVHQAAFCVVDGCCYAHRQGFRTCDSHAAVEDHHVATGQALFTLRMRLQRAQVTHPTDAIEPDAPVEEDVDLDDTLDGPCPEKPVDGNRRVRARFGRRRTHNEQLIVRPCGIITARETFYGAETTPQVLDMLHKKHLIPGSMPRFVYYDNNCGLYKHCAATAGEDLHTRIGLPVDVFHWKCKHKKTDVECSFHCNPHMFPELLNGDRSWYFNSSRAEQTNVWFGGYHAIVREMGAVKYEFFLDEMILRKNELTRAKLEAEGWTPGYRDDIRFAGTNVSL
ncbi:uncharacterized protein TRAVEDRAFT_137153 [Trametes versicolor FP-101664 SS1]|uniref:CxC5 like cysteine cluster associated with KDZ domain-containing protein n=1 Tax=Trametes versicolor (strain FP-101664) TaxID=717944 RepID=R7S7I5_TRAVS|nr:uncharacterized protein TRAVEDRAFT_137153 [Trametes versicolor FP-101664 SS1]EIW51585.1 hypothetical protein TRAVEDRAFT_137153 [Trametes versicolor FP-101664 SS1]